MALAGWGGSEETTTETTPAPAPVREPSEPRAPGERPPPVGEGEGGVRLEELGEFDQPVYVTQPDGDPEHLYVVEQCGRIQRLPIEGGSAETFLDISGLITCGAEQGLLSVAFAPDYEKSGRLYVDYTDTGGDTRVVEYRRDPADSGQADPGSARELLFLDDPYPNHNGGLLLFGPDRRLYIGQGDGGGGGDPLRAGQDLTSLFGKILRIDPLPNDEEPYSIPKDNPHLDDPGARAEIAVHGLRNPWRFTFDRKTGDLWIGDVGQSSREEIDAAPLNEITGLDAGLNFGWSAFEGSERYNSDQEAPGARPPVLEYGREGGCSVTGGYVVRNPQLRSLYGRYLYGDYCGGKLRSFTARRGGEDRPGLDSGDDRPLGIEISSLSSFGEDLAGRLYATSLSGPVYRLAPVEGD